MMDLAKHCELYSTALRKGIHSLLEVDVGDFSPATQAEKIELREDHLTFSVLILGPVHGEFLFSISKKMGLDLLGIKHDDSNREQLFETHRHEVCVSFKEIINLAAGKPLAELKKVFPHLSISPPRMIEGKIFFSDIIFYKSGLLRDSEIECYLYIDEARTDISHNLEAAQKQIQEEHQRQEELKRLSRAKSEFLANMSHELRTPLNGIIGMIDLIKGSGLTHTQKDQLDIIYQSGEFLLSIINDILDFSKIEAGKMILEKTPFDLRKSIETVASTFSQSIDAKGLDFYVQIDPRIQDQVTGDELRFKQVISNLLGNAAKFTNSGFIKLEAQLIDKNVRVSIQDSGIGIPKTKLNLIFESFTQSDSSDTRKYGGSGLGLTISKSMIEAMGGRLTVESIEGVGSTFAFTCPFQELSPVVSQEVAPFSILVVDPRADHHTIMRSYLEYLGCRVQVFKDFSDELDLSSFDRILIDYGSLRKLPAASRKAILNYYQESQKHVILMGLRAQLFRVSENYRRREVMCLNYPIRLSSLEQALFGSITSPEKLERPLTGLPVILSQAKTLQPRSANETHAATLKILLVEDNPVNQLVAQAMLKKMGHSLEVAENGQVAVEKVRSTEYDVIFMDCQMPIMDGFEATRQIRGLSDQSKSTVPIIALTANAFLEVKKQCEEAGMDRFLTKPFHQEQIEKVIQEVRQLKSA